MTAMDFRHYMNDLGRFTGMDELGEVGIDLTPYHFANNNPISFSDPTGLYTGDPNGNFSTTDPNEISALLGYFKGGGSLSNVGSFVLGNSTFSKEIPEVVLKGSRLRTFFTGDYFSKDNALSIFKHLDKHIGSMATVSAWDGDRGFWGNWSGSDNFFAKLSYGIMNNTYLALQSVDTLNLMGGKNVSGITGNQEFSNLDGTTQFDSEERGMAFASTFNPIGPKLGVSGLGKQVLPTIPFRMTGKFSPLSASQFSSVFKGTSISSASPAVRGAINQIMNKGLNGANSFGTFKSAYITIIKWIMPSQENNKK